MSTDATSSLLRSTLGCFADLASTREFVSWFQAPLSAEFCKEQTGSGNVHVEIRKFCLHFLYSETETTGVRTRGSNQASFLAG